MKQFLLLSLLFFAGLPLMCGNITRGTTIKSITNAFTPQEARLQRIITQHMDRAVLKNSQAARWAHSNRIAYFKSAKTVPFRSMAPLSAPVITLPINDPIFALRNDKIALPWFETIEKDLAFLQRHQESIYQALSISRLDPQDIDYAHLIPPQARKIFVGEEHNHPAIYKAFETMVLQYHALYPHRKIIVLTEFVSDRLLPWQMPGKPVKRLEMPFRRNDKDFVFFNKFIKEGIDVIGLENLAYIKEHEALFTPSESQYESVFGMQERNAHWRRIISYVASNNPQATLFIYAGSMHTHYRAPFSLTTPSPQNFVLQLESQFLGPDMPFGYAMKEEPFIRAYGKKVTLLRWEEKDPVFRNRSGFDACLIFPKEDL